MLKFEHWGGKTMLRVEGNLAEIAADIGLALALIHGDILEKKS